MAHSLNLQEGVELNISYCFPINSFPEGYIIRSLTAGFIPIRWPNMQFALLNIIFYFGYPLLKGKVR
jgi:hypothetical protein